jgi:hypothetical protein
MVCRLKMHRMKFSVPLYGLSTENARILLFHLKVEVSPVCVPLYTTCSIYGEQCSTQ